MEDMQPLDASKDRNEVDLANAVGPYAPTTEI
jgi:hypothetical protein